MIDLEENIQILIFNTKHNVMSVAKVFTSAFVGIAIDHGFIQSVDEKLFFLLKIRPSKK
jgi:hypothetical protein